MDLEQALAEIARLELVNAELHEKCDENDAEILSLEGQVAGLESRLAALASPDNNDAKSCWWCGKK